MKENYEAQSPMGQKNLTWVGIIAVGFLLALSLGGLIYFFVVSVP